MILWRWELPLEPVRINVCYYKANKDHFPHNFIFASDDESQDIWGLAEYQYPGMIKVSQKTYFLEYLKYKYQNLRNVINILSISFE